MKKPSDTELRPLDLAGILDGTLSLFRLHLSLFVGIAAVVLVPLGAAQFVGQIYFPVTLDPSTLRPHLDRPAFWTFLQGFDYTLSFIGNGAIVAAVTDLLLERRPTVADAFRTALSRFGALTLTGLMTAAAVLLGFKLMYVPGYIAGLACAFAADVVLLEGKQGVDALRRSAQLMLEDGQWLRACQLGIVLIGVLGAASSMAFALVALVTPESTVGTYIRGVVGLTIQLAAMPLALVSATLLYIDIRVRRESYTRSELVAERAGR